MKRHGGPGLWWRLRQRFHDWVERMRLRVYGTNHKGIQEGEPAIAPALPEYATPLSESLMVKPLTRVTSLEIVTSATEPPRTWDEIADQEPKYDGIGFTRDWVDSENRQLQAKLYGLQYDPEVPWEDARDATPVELDESEPERSRKARKASAS